MPQAIFFDLDGTLLDSQSGILQSLQHVFTEIGEVKPSNDELRGMIGASLTHIFANFLGSHSDIDYAIEVYREFYTQKVMFDAELYDGILEMLDTMQSHNIDLYIATSKPHVLAQKITDYFGISKYITRVFGSELDGTNADKTDLLQFILDETGFNPEKCIMIGDRSFDIMAAQNNDISSIGVLWGYGSLEELRVSEADLLVAHPEEIFEISFDLIDIHKD